MNVQPHINGLKAAESASPGTAAVGLTGLPAENNRRILIIDDNRAIHDDFHKILAPETTLSAALEATEASLFGNPANPVPKIQFTVDSAYQGQEGLMLVKKASAERRPYALAFVDVRMPPGWDGVETTQRILEIDPDIQIVICTAYADYSWAEMFEKLGHRDGLLILKKPFDAVEALQLAHALTEKWWLHLLSRRKLEDLESMVSVRTGELRQTNLVLETKIVEHEHAETMLRESDQKFRQLADHITDAFWIRSPDMRKVHYISPAFKQIWGRSVESLYANPHQWTDFIVPEDRDRVLSEFAALTEARPSLDIEYRIARPDGEIRWVRVKGFQIRDASGKLIRHAGIVTDITDRQRAAEELLGSERRFSDMLRNLELVSVMLDRDGRITYCNDYLLRLTGWKREEVMGEDWFERFLPPEHFQELRRVHSALLDDQPAAWHYENEIVTRSGARRLIRWNNSALRSASGEVIGTASIGEDITERKQAEAALQSSEARTKAIVQSSLDCIVTMDHAGKILEFNPAAEKVFGYVRAEVLGKELAQVIIPPSLRERHRQGMKHYLATGEARVIGKRIEITALRSDGSEFPVELAITRLGTEMPATFTGFMRDISDRQRAERQLNIQFAISRVLAESSTAEDAKPKILQAVCETFGWDVSAFWTWDSRDGVLHCAGMWNAPNVPVDEFRAASNQMTLAPTIGLPGRVWASGQPAWIADVVQDGNFPRALAAKQAGLHAALAFPILEGSAVSGVIEIFGREIREPDEDLLRTFAVLGSQLGQFFQRRRLEEQLLQSQKMETVGKLAGGVAHEFNSIMTAIIGQTELLLTDLPAGNPLSKNATEIRKAADRAATLTRQLLAYGRKQILQPEVLDVNSILAGMESTLGHLLGEATDIRLALAPGLKAVRADAGQIEQVILNIAMNAGDAMPNGGKLTLETANATLDQEYVSRISGLKAGEYVMLAITDSGAGMSDEVKARVFEPFYTTKGVGQGTGLGLSTCYGIVKQSGGHLCVYSELAHGSTFKIYLPQVEPLPRTPVLRLDSSAHPRGTETILLVEDDPALREMAATLLERLGYTVLAAANGLEALRLRQQRETEPIHLLFTDVVMPHMSGKELSERVLALSPRTRVLFTSAYTENAIVHQGVLNQGVALLQKPFTPTKLAHKVREVLDQPNALAPPG